MNSLLMHPSTTRTVCQRQCLHITCSSKGSSSRRAHVRADQQQQPQSNRRNMLLHSSALLLAMYTRPASADVEDLERQLPGLPALDQQAQQLPKPYQRTMHKLVNALRTSIEAEAGGAQEREVRRKADPAKELVKEFINTWQNNAAVAGDVTHDEMKGALSELGKFYQANGPRSRLDDRTKQSVLAHLSAIDAALPPEEKSLLGF